MEHNFVVSVREYQKATDTWNIMYNGGTTRWLPHDFMKFIGYEHAYRHPDARRINVTEAAYNKIKMLSSPHAYALMKAFIARTGYHKKLPSVEVVD